MIEVEESYTSKTSFIDNEELRVFNNSEEKNLTQGDKNQLSKDVSKLDVGGLAVTLYRLVSDGRFISQLKREFLEKEFYNAVLENVYEK